MFKKYLSLTLKYHAKHIDISTVILHLSFNISCIRDAGTLISFANLYADMPNSA